MERELRLAERRGVFQRASLSPVAEFGLALLEYVDNRKNQERDWREVRLAMLTSDMNRFAVLFPDEADVFGIKQTDVVEDGTPEAEEAMRRGDTVEDYSQVEWKSPSDMDDSEFADLLQLQQTVTANATQSVPIIEGGEWL